MRIWLETDEPVPTEKLDWGKQAKSIWKAMNGHFALSKYQCSYQEFWFHNPILRFKCEGSNWDFFRINSIFNLYEGICVGKSGWNNFKTSFAIIAQSEIWWINKKIWFSFPVLLCNSQVSDANYVGTEEACGDREAWMIETTDVNLKCI